MTETFVGYRRLSSPIAPKYDKNGNKTVTESGFILGGGAAAADPNHLFFCSQQDVEKYVYSLQCEAIIMDPSEHPMPIQTEKRPLLTDTLPSFATELEHLLTERGEPELASQVPTLAIHDRCRCNDDLCATFYTRPKPNGAYGSGHRNVALVPNEGFYFIVDVVDGKIACVEVLDRDDVRRKLEEVLP